MWILSFVLLILALLTIVIGGFRLMDLSSETDGWTSFASGVGVLVCLVIVIIGCVYAKYIWQHPQLF